MRLHSAHVCVIMISVPRGKCAADGRKKMTCKDFSDMLPGFFGDRLDTASLTAFLDHYDHCEDCREELEIQYLVDKAFLEEDVSDEINLHRDLPAFIEKERMLLHSRMKLRNIAAVIETVTITAVILTVLLYLS